MYANSLACVKLKWNVSKSFKNDCGMRQGCIMYLSLFNMFTDTDEKGENRCGEDGSEIYA